MVDGSFGRVSFSGPDGHDVVGYKPTRTSPQNLFVIAGQRLYRLGPTGALNTSFGSGGSVSLPVGTQLAIRQSSIYVTGSGDTEAKIAKYSVDGVIDASFGTLGVFSQSAFQDCGGSLPNSQVLFYETYYRIGFQSDGKIITAGHFYGFDGEQNFTYALLNRHQPDGDFDSSFPPTCGYSAPVPQGFINSLKILPDDGILFNDQSASRIFRLTAAGAPNGDFQTASQARDFVVQPDGKIVVVGRVDVGGTSHTRLSRYLQ